MKHTKYIFIFCSFLFLSNYKSYKEYEFDYIIEYSSSIHGSEPYSVFYLTNSKDNSYWASFYNLNEESFNLTFRKHGSISRRAVINKKEFYKAETIFMERGFAHVKAISERSAKKTGFLKLNDTIINNTTHQHFEFKTLKSKKKDLVIHYIIEPSTENHLPVLFYPDAYVEWKVEKNLPNGIFKELYYTNDNNEFLENHLKLVGYQPYNKVIRMKF